MHTKKTFYKIQMFTDIGKVRESNEDSYLFVANKIGKSDFILAAVADGMGGLSNGKQASESLILGLKRWYEKELDFFQNIQISCTEMIKEVETSLERCIGELNEFILNTNQKSGTTLSLLMIIGNTYLVRHAGDSRIYFLRDFGLEQVTTDHTWFEVARERQTIDYENDNIEKMKNTLVNAVGVKKSYFLDVGLGSMDNIRSIFLCSDGVYRYLSKSELEEILKSNLDTENKKRAMESVLQNSEARDNYTGILIEKEKRWRKS